MTSLAPTLPVQAASRQVRTDADPTLVARTLLTRRIPHAWGVRLVHLSLDSDLAVVFVAIEANNPWHAVQAMTNWVARPEGGTIATMSCRLDLERTLRHVADSVGWEIRGITPRGTATLVEDRYAVEPGTEPRAVAVQLRSTGELVLVHDGRVREVDLTDGVESVASALVSALQGDFGVCFHCEKVRRTQALQGVVGYVETCRECRDA